MSQHVLRVRQNFCFQIRLIRRLGKALSVESKLFLVHALVHSRLDYCNSVLARLPWSLVQQLHAVCVEFCCSYFLYLLKLLTCAEPDKLSLASISDISVPDIISVSVSVQFLENNSSCSSVSVLNIISVSYTTRHNHIY